jgi:hypothetical protein
VSPFEWDEPQLTNDVALLLHVMQGEAIDPAEQFDEDGWTWGEVRRSQQWLADAIGRDKRTVRRQNARLIALGWVRVKTRGGHNRDSVTTYEVRLRRA